MPHEREILARARPHILAEKAKGILFAEVSKGCRPDLSPRPVALEPFFRPVQSVGELLADSDPRMGTIEAPPRPEELTRLQVWI